MSKIARASLHKHYVLGLLSGSKSLTDMSERGLLPFSKQYACKLLAQDPTPHKDALARRLANAPQGAYLAVDLLKVEHPGERIEGVGRCYDSNSRGIVWGHTWVSSALVRLRENPYILRCDPFLDQLMGTKLYPRPTATEAMLGVAGDVVTAGVKVIGVRSMGRILYSGQSLRQDANATFFTAKSKYKPDTRP